jgi:uncharacterized protein YebE (UPF0316 family)
VEVAILALLAMLSVCLWTLRVAATTRGYRLLAPPLAAVEAIVYATAFGRLLTDLGSVERKLAFGPGVAAGTYVAMIAADRFSAATASSPLAPPGIRSRRATRLDGRHRRPRSRASPRR